MFRRLRTARRMNASYSPLRQQAAELDLDLLQVRCLRRGSDEKFRACASSPTDQTSSEGRRMLTATHPWVVAGGSAICTRSPLGSEAESSGDVSSIRCRLKFATSFANRRHQSRSA